MSDETKDLNEDTNETNVIDMENIPTEQLNTEQEQSMSDEEFENKSEQIIDEEQQKAEFLKKMRDRVELKIRQMLNIPEPKQETSKGISYYKANFEDTVEPLVRNIVQKNKGYARVIYAMPFDINKIAPIILYGYIKLNREINSIVMKIIYGHGDFPDGVMAQFPVDKCSILWYEQENFLNICCRVEQLRINELAKTEHNLQVEQFEKFAENLKQVLLKSEDIPVWTPEKNEALRSHMLNKAKEKNVTLKIFCDDNQQLVEAYNEFLKNNPETTEGSDTENAG